MHTISKYNIYDKSKNFLPKGDADKKIGLKIVRTWRYLFLIDKVEILDLLSLRFIEQNK